MGSAPKKVRPAMNSQAEPFTITHGLTDSRMMTYMQSRLTRVDHALWFATYLGVSRYDLNSRSFSAEILPIFARAIAVEPEGNSLWFGTSTGARRYDLDRRTFTTRTNVSYLPSTAVGTILAEPETNALWMGTAGGAIRFNLESGGFDTYRVADGLAGNHVQAITPGTRQ